MLGIYYFDFRFDHHVDHSSVSSERMGWHQEQPEAKRLRLDIKLEDDEVNDNFSFPEAISSSENTTLK